MHPVTPLVALWLPIIGSAVLVFIVSSLIHMLTPWHAGDYKALAQEDKFGDAVRPLAIPPGDYFVPRAGSMKDLSSPEFNAKLDRGPVLMMTVYPNGRHSMGRSLGLWFLYSVVVGIFAGYIAGRALPPGAHYLQVFRFAGATAFLGYSAALWQFWIWYRRSFGTTLRSTIDGLLYALLTAGMFGWLWPK